MFNSVSKKCLYVFKGDHPEMQCSALTDWYMIMDDYGVHRRRHFRYCCGHSVRRLEELNRRDCNDLSESELEERAEILRQIDIRYPVFRNNIIKKALATRPPAVQGLATP